MSPCFNTTSHPTQPHPYMFRVNVFPKRSSASWKLACRKIDFELEVGRFLSDYYREEKIASLVFYFYQSLNNGE